MILRDKLMINLFYSLVEQFVVLGKVTQILKNQICFFPATMYNRILSLDTLNK